MNVESWLNESHSLAESTVYDSEVTGYLRGYVDKAEAPPLHLSERYLKTAVLSLKAVSFKPDFGLGPF